MMKLKPIPLALGMNPLWWATRFSIISKQLWFDMTHAQRIRVQRLPQPTPSEAVAQVRKLLEDGALE